MTNDNELTRAVVQVSGGGRGFVVALGPERVIITAAHCLPWEELPRPHLGRFVEEATFKLLGPLGRKPTVLAECKFVDLIADMAVLGKPDGQVFLDEEAAAFDELVDGVTPLAVGKAPAQESKTVTLSPELRFRRYAEAIAPARVLSLDGQWLDVTAKQVERARSSPSLRLTVEPATLIKGGMSGSPIIGPDGAAMAVISTGNFGPIILEALPAQMARALRRKRAARTSQRHDPG